MGGERWRFGGRRNHMKWSGKLWKASLPTSWKTSRLDTHESSTEINFFSLLQQRGLISVWLCRIKVGQVHHYHPEEQTQMSETEEVPQSAHCLSPAQCQTGDTPLGQVNRRLCAFIQMLPRAAWIDKGWQVWCRGIGGVWKSTSALWQGRYWSHQWGIRDTINHNYFNLTSLCSGVCKLKMWGC